jgi:hypothetical protein
VERVRPKESEEESYNKWVKGERARHLRITKAAAEAAHIEKGAREYGKGLRSERKRQGRRGRFEADAEEGSEDSEDSEDSETSSSSSFSNTDVLSNSSSSGKATSKSSNKSRSRRNLDDDDVITGRSSSRIRDTPDRSIRRAVAKASKRDELAEHIYDTDRRELRRESALAMCEEALKQLGRRARGRVLSRRENELANLGAPPQVDDESPASPVEVEDRLFAANRSGATEAPSEWAIVSLCLVGDRFKNHPYRREVYLIDQSGDANPTLDYAVNDAVQSINAFLDEGRTVLVHCHGGRSRTGLILKAWKMKKEGWFGHDGEQLAHNWLAQKWHLYQNTDFRHFLRGE